VSSLGGCTTNPSLGLELTVDPILAFSAPDLKGKPGFPPGSVAIAAWSKSKFGSTFGGVAFSAVALTYYPENQRSTDSCMRRVIEANQKGGFDRIHGVPEGQFAGISFVRADFLRRDTAVYQAAFVKAYDSIVFILVVTGPDQVVVDKLIASTKLKMESAVSR
jgi:hypothetical protein